MSKKPGRKRERKGRRVIKTNDSDFSPFSLPFASFFVDGEERKGKFPHFPTFFASAHTYFFFAQPGLPLSFREGRKRLNNNLKWGEREEREGRWLRVRLSRSTGEISTQGKRRREGFNKVFNIFWMEILH